MLIHIGLNTVELNGEGYTAHVKDGDRVSAGQTLITFDKKAIEEKGYDTITPVIVTNSDDYEKVIQAATGDINIGEPILSLVR